MSLHNLPNEVDSVEYWDYLIQGWYDPTIRMIMYFLLIPIAMLLRGAILWYLVTIRNESPIATSVSDKIANRIFSLLAGKNLYYPKMSNIGGERIIATDQFLMSNRFTLLGYCSACNVYGHTTKMTSHPISANSIYYANLFAIYNSEQHKVETNMTMDLQSQVRRNIISQDRDTRFALLPAEMLKTHKVLNTTAGIVYVNKTQQLPHLFILGYNNDGDCVGLVKYFTAIERVTIYGNENLKNLLPDHNVYDIPTLTEDVDYFDIAMNVLKTTYKNSIFKLISVIEDSDLKENPNISEDNNSKIGKSKNKSIIRKAPLRINTNKAKPKTAPISESKLQEKPTESTLNSAQPQENESQQESQKDQPSTICNTDVKPLNIKPLINEDKSLPNMVNMSSEEQVEKVNTPERSAELLTVGNIVRSLVNSRKQPVYITDILIDYLDMESEPLPYKRLNYPSAFKLLKATDMFEFEVCEDDVKIIAKTNEKSKHIIDMIKKQKPSRTMPYKKQNTIIQELPIVKNAENVKQLAQAIENSVQDNKAQWNKTQDKTQPIKSQTFVQSYKPSKHIKKHFAVMDPFKKEPKTQSVKVDEVKIENRNKRTIPIVPILILGLCLIPLSNAVCVNYTVSENHNIANLPLCGPNILASDLPYVNYIMRMQKCFGLGSDNAYDTLLNLQYKNTLNLKEFRNLKSIQMESRTIQKPLIFTRQTRDQLALLKLYYDLTYTQNFNVNSTQAVLYITREDYADVNIKTNATIIYIYDSDEYICAEDCTLFKNFEVQEALVININKRITRKLYNDPSGSIVRIDPNCYETCPCYEPQVKVIEKSKIIYSPQFFYLSSYMRAYHQRLTEALQDETITQQSFTLTRFVYKNTEIPCENVNTKGLCVFDPKDTELKICSYLGEDGMQYTLECVITDEYCVDILDYICSNETENIHTETKTIETDSIIIEKVEESTSTKLETVKQLEETIKHEKHCSLPILGDYKQKVFMIIPKVYKRLLIPIMLKPDMELSVLKHLFAYYECLGFTYKDNTFKADDNYHYYVYEGFDQELLSYYGHYFHNSHYSDPLNKTPARAILFYILRSDETIANLTQFEQFLESYFAPYGITNDAAQIRIIYDISENYDMLLQVENFEQLSNSQITHQYEKSENLHPKQSTIRESQQSHFLTHINYHNITQFIVSIYNQTIKSVHEKLIKPLIIVEDIFQGYTISAIKTCRKHFIGRFLGCIQTLQYNTLQYIDTIRNNFDKNYQKYIHPAIKAFYNGNMCELLNHVDTNILYEACVHDNLETVYLIKPVYHYPNSDYRKIKVAWNRDPNTIMTDFKTSIGFEYLGKNYIYYRPLFTQHGDFVHTFYDQTIRWCKTTKSGSIAYNAMNTECYPYITGFKVADSLMYNITPRYIFMTLATLLIVTVLASYFHSRNGGFKQLVARSLVLLTFLSSSFLKNVYIFGFFLSEITWNGIAVTLSFSAWIWIVFTIVQILDVARTFSQSWLDTRAYYTVALCMLELLCYAYFYCLPNSAFDNMLCFICISFIAMVIFKYNSRENWERTSVSLRTAANDWSAYRNTLKNATDDAAKRELGRVMTYDIATLTPSKVQQYSYLLQCYQNTMLGPYNPNDAMQIRQMDMKNLYLSLTHDTMINQNKLVNQNSNTNPSCRYVNLKLKPEINPLITFKTSTYHSSLYGAIVNNYCYVERHIFGSDRKTFEQNYDNGQGLKHCNLNPVKYDIENATIHNTLIKIPMLVDIKTEFKLHRDPLQYIGPVQMYIADTIVHGFMQNGRMDIKTYNGDCGGMIFTNDGLFLGLHCAGSADVKFQTTTGISNIWSGYVCQTPSALMITLSGKINLPDPVDYDFKQDTVIYNHPLRDIKHTLQTLQHLTNPTSKPFAYDNRLYADFCITKEDYEAFGYNVDYEKFVRNFSKYCRATIGPNGLEYCLKYGVELWEKLTSHNGYIQVASLICPKYNLFDRLPTCTHFFYILYLLDDYKYFYVCALCFLLTELAIHLTHKTKRAHLLNTAIYSIIALILYVYNAPIVSYIWNRLAIRGIYGLINQLSAFKISATMFNQNKTEHVIKIAKTVGTQQNLCSVLSAFVKIIKVIPAFDKLEHVVNTLDDLQATWNDVSDPVKILNECVLEIYELYPTLFITLAYCQDENAQINLLLNYISENGEVNMEALENLNEPYDYEKFLKDLKEEIQRSLQDNQALLQNLAELREHQSDLPHCDITGLLKDEGTIAEFINCLSNLDDTILIDKRDIIEKLGLKLIDRLKVIRDDPDKFLVESFSEYYLLIKQYQEHIENNNSNLDTRLKNYYVGLYARIASQLLRNIHIQDQHNLQRAHAEEKQRKKEATKQIQHINRIRKIQKRNQVIAYAIHQMVQLCIANRYVLQNESSIIGGLYKNIINFLDSVKVSDLPLCQPQKLSPTLLANQAYELSLNSTLWSGTIYSTISSICGDILFRCTLDHAHSYYKCNKGLFKIWYEHTDKCNKCREYYAIGRHPVCGARYEQELINETRRPNFVNFARRYRSCVACLPCDTCLDTREPQCTKNCSHYNTIVHNQAFLAPAVADVNNFTYERKNNSLQASYNGRLAIIRYSQLPSSVPPRFRRLMRSPPQDPNGIYYIADIFGPGEIGTINAIINTIIAKANEVPEEQLYNQNKIVDATVTIEISGNCPETTIQEIQSSLNYNCIYKNNTSRTLTIKIFKNDLPVYRFTKSIETPAIHIVEELNNILINNDLGFY